MGHLPQLLAQGAPTFLATFCSFCLASQATLKTWIAVRYLPHPLVSAEGGRLAAKPRLGLALLALLLLAVGIAEVSFLLEWIPQSSAVDYAVLFLAGFCIELCLVEFVGDLTNWVKYAPTRLEDGSFEFVVVPNSQSLVATIMTACGAFAISLSAWMGFQDGHVNLSAIILATAVLSRSIIHTSTSLRVVSMPGIIGSLGLWSLLMSLGGVFTLLNLRDGYGALPSYFSRRLRDSILAQAKPYVYHIFSVLCSTAPGLLVAAARRFDDSRQEKSISLDDESTPEARRSGVLSSPYFMASFAGWIGAQALAALLLAFFLPFACNTLSTEERQSVLIVSRTVLEAPMVMLSCLAFALLRGEVSEFWSYAEPWMVTPVVRRPIERDVKNVVILRE